MSADARQSIAFVHLLLFLILGVGGGGGAVVGKFGLSTSDPLVFGFIRDACAATVLAFWARKAEGPPKIPRHLLPRLLLPGCLLLCSHTGFAVAAKELNAVVLTGCDAVIPVCTVVLAVLGGWEKITVWKVGGSLFAFLGAAFLTFFEQDVSNNPNIPLGSAFMVMNICAYSTYVLISGPIAKEVGEITFTSISVGVTAILLLAVHGVVSHIPAINNTLCPPDSCTGWRLSPSAWCALGYFVLVFTVMHYWVVAWARQQINGSAVSAYIVVPPLVAAFLNFLLVQSGIAERWPNVDLSEPGWNALGGIGIVAGIAIVILGDEPARRVDMRTACLTEELRC